MAKSSGKGEGKSTPSTSTATDAASVAVNSGKQSSENAGLTTPSNPSKGENNNPSNDSQATDAAGVTLGRGEYTPGATYNAQGQQTSGWSQGPGMGSSGTSTPSFNEVFEEAKKNRMEQVQEKGILESLMEGAKPAVTNNPTVLSGLANLLGSYAGFLNPNGKGKGEDGKSTPAPNDPSAVVNAALNSGLMGGPYAAPPPSDSKAAPNTESVTTPSDTADSISNLGPVLGHNDYTPGTPAETSANNNVNQQAQSSSGYINRGSTVSTNGTGGSISSGLSAPVRDSSSIGLGVFDPDKANYDQDNWNRGMEVQSSSVVSDEQCKQFAMRAFHEDSPAFKVVKTTIIKKLD